VTPTTGMGFDIGGGSTIQGCTAGLNQGDGINILSDTVSRDNTCDSNGLGGDGAGIHATSGANRIEGNNVVNNDRGLHVEAIRNFIARNTARTNTFNYIILAGNRVAQIVVPAVNAADINGANSGSSDGFTNVDPWANFSY
jgi:parallel beta-helix repeat protein